MGSRFGYYSPVTSPIRNCLQVGGLNIGTCHLSQDVFWNQVYTITTLD